MRPRFVKRQKNRVLEHQVAGNSYWNWVSQHVVPGETGVSEEVQANPDSLQESDGMFSLTSRQIRTQERVRELLKKAPQFLTEKQYTVFLMVTEGLNLREIARKLGRAHTTIQEVWKTAQSKLLKEYTRDEDL